MGLYIAQKIKIKVPKSAKSKKSETSNNKIGLLIITNFRLSFVSFDDNDENSVNIELLNFFSEGCDDRLSYSRFLVLGRA